MAEGVERPKRRSTRDLRELQGLMDQARAEAAASPEQPENAENVPQDEVADDTHRESENAPAITHGNESLQQGERPEWTDIIRRTPQGAVKGKNFWRATDGAVYVDLGGSMPIRVAHGGSHVFRVGGQEERLYWDAHKDTFTEILPADRVARERNTEQAVIGQPIEENQAPQSGVSNDVASSETDHTAAEPTPKMDNQAVQSETGAAAPARSRSARPRGGTVRPRRAGGSGGGAPPNGAGPNENNSSPESPRHPDPDSSQSRDEFVADHREPDVDDQPKRGRGSSPREIDRRNYANVVVKPIREILANERDQQLFGETLRSLEHEDVDGVLRRYNEGIQTKEDMDFLSFGAYEYARALKVAEEVNANITKEDIELLSTRDRDLFNLITHEGVDRTLQISKEMLLHKAMRHPADLEDMLVEQKRLAEERSRWRFRNAEGRIEMLCEKLGIDRRNYEAVVNFHTDEDRKKSLTDMEKRFHERAGSYRKTMDWINAYTKIDLPGTSRRAALKAAAFAERTETGRVGLTSFVMKRVNGHLQTIADHIGPIVSNQEMRALVAREMLSNMNSRPASESGPRTFENVQELVRDRFSPASIENRIRENIKADTRWATRSEKEQNERLREIKKEELKNYPRGRGFWSWLFWLIFGRNFEKAASAAAGRAVRV